MAGGASDSDVAVGRWRRRVKTQRVNSDNEGRRVPRRESQPAEPPRPVAEAAVELGLSVHTIRAWVAARRLAHIRLGRAIRIPASEIRRVIDANTIPAVEEP